ncbi:MAG: alpha/beta fold hydrolase [Gammaproteobacteria bacterium]
MRVAAASVVGAALAWALACAALAAMQHDLVFRPQRGAGATPAVRGLAFEDLTLTGADGVAIHAWYLPGPAQPGRTVLFLHGNAGNLSHRLHTLAVLHRLGHPVLAIDYRGYGRSHGRPSEDGLHADALAAWHHLLERRGLAAHDIVIYGRSLGGAVAARLAAAAPPHVFVTLAGSHNRAFRASAATYHPRLGAFIASGR